MAITVNLPAREGESITDIEAAEAAALAAVEAQETTSVAAVGAAVGVAVAAQVPPAVSAEVAESAAGPSGELYVATQASLTAIGAAEDAILTPVTGTLAVAEADAIAAISASDALGSVSVALNMEQLQAAYDGFRKIERPNATGGASHVGICGYGDSMADPAEYAMELLALSLEARYGSGGYFTPGLGRSWSGAAWTLAGGATQPRTDYTYFPGANQIVLPSGGSATTALVAPTIASGDVLAGAISTDVLRPTTPDDIEKVVFFYLKRPGDGTLTFQVTQTGLTYSAEVVSCDAALALAKVEVTVKNPGKAITISATASVAGCIFVGALFKRSSGVLLWSGQVGGSTMTSQRAFIDNGNVSGVFTTLCTELNTCLFVHAQRVPGDANWQANYTDTFTALAAIAGTDQLVLGEPLRTTELSPTTTDINAWLRAYCITNGLAFIDQRQAMGSNNANLAALDWTGDGVHLGAKCWRFQVATILKYTNAFRTGLSRLEAAPITKADLNRERFQLFAIASPHDQTFIGNAAAVLVGGATSGGYAYAPEADRGYRFNDAAAVGYSVGRLGTSAMSVSHSMTVDWAMSIMGWRSLNILAGVRAFVMVGVTSSLITLAGLTQKSVGLEFAKGSDVGSPGGTTAEVVRIFAYDGTSVLTSEWVNVVLPGSSVANQSGFKATLIWDSVAGRLTLYSSSNVSRAEKRAILDVPNLIGQELAGAYVHAGILGEDAGNVPAGGSYLCFKEIKLIWNHKMPYPWGTVT